MHTSQPGLASVTSLPWVDEVVAAKHDRVAALLDDGGPGLTLEPIANLRTWKVIGHQARPSFDTGAASSWFADAQDAGMTADLESAVLTETLEVLGTTPPDTFVTVRLSPATVRSLDAVPRAHRLVVELSTAVDGCDREALDAEPLRSCGGRFALGEMGTGFASLRQAQRLDPDFLKIAVELVDSIDRDPQRRALVSTIVAFARKMGYIVIAEGIATDAELETLLRIGVRYGQGPRVGQPKLVRTPFALRSGTEWVGLPALEPKFHSRRRRRTIIAALAASLAISASASAASFSGSGGSPEPPGVSRTTVQR